jgi:hypothetical protein
MTETKPFLENLVDTFCGRILSERDELNGMFSDEN